jgi:hypothetical protein
MDANSGVPNAAQGSVQQAEAQTVKRSPTARFSAPSSARRGESAPRQHDAGGRPTIIVPHWLSRSRRAPSPQDVISSDQRVTDAPSAYRRRSPPGAEEPGSRRRIPSARPEHVTFLWKLSSLLIPTPLIRASPLRPRQSRLFTTRIASSPPAGATGKVMRRVSAAHLRATGDAFRPARSGGAARISPAAQSFTCL